MRERVGVPVPDALAGDVETHDCLSGLRDSERLAFRSNQSVALCLLKPQLDYRPDVLEAQSETLYNSKPIITICVLLLEPHDHVFFWLSSSSDQIYRIAAEAEDKSGVEELPQ